MKRDLGNQDSPVDRDHILRNLSKVIEVPHVSFSDADRQPDLGHGQEE